MLPIRIGSDDDFSRVRGFLRDSNFTLEAICKRLRIELPFEFMAMRPGAELDGPADELDLLIRLFVVGESIAPEQLRALVPVRVATALAALGLTMEFAPHAPRVYSPVALCPMEGLFLASDRWSMPDNSKCDLPPDAVYPAHTESAQVFVRNISREPCESLLDVCSGTGIGALIAASQFARHAVAADIATRCATFAEFNRRLNGLQNVTVVESDLFAAFEGQTFDRVLAHPPYVPVLRPKYLYRDGGSDGEQITRRIIEAIPRYLAPGGRFECHVMLSDRDIPVEKRLREWLGAEHTEFDIALLVFGYVDPMQFAANAALQEGGGEALRQWRHHFREWKVERLVDCAIQISRHEERAESPLDVRKMAGPHSTPAELAWLLSWERMTRQTEIDLAILRAHPRAADGLAFTTRHVIEEGELRVAECRAIAVYPFASDCALQPWMPPLLAECNGQRTGRELFELARQREYVRHDTPPEQFARLLRQFISNGFIILDEFAPPREPYAAAVSAE